MSGQAEVTAILRDRDDGDRRAADRLVAIVYDELRDRAELLMRRERPGHTLRPTALVHEVYLRLVDQTHVDWKGRTHFLAVAVDCMKDLLKGHHRQRNRLKRGGGWKRITFDEAVLVAPEPDVKIDDFFAALEDLQQEDERKARVVELKVLGGMGERQIAEALATSTKTVERDRRAARAWLIARLEDD